MKRVLHWLMSLAALASLIVCVISCALWAGRRGPLYYFTLLDLGINTRVDLPPPAFRPGADRMARRYGVTTCGQWPTKGRGSEPRFEGVFDGFSIHAFDPCVPVPGPTAVILPGGFAPAFNAWLSAIRQQDSFHRLAGVGYTSWTVVQIEGVTLKTAIVGHQRDVEIPYWLIVSASAALPLLAARRLAKARAAARRRRRGLCLACGYDLRATAGQCPECGAPPERRIGATRI